MHSSDRHSSNDDEISQWLTRIIEDDEEAFAMLLRHFWNKVYTQALTYLKSTVNAQELTQDVFVKVWTNRDKLAEVYNFSGYLFTITRNEIYSLLRKKEPRVTEHNEILEEQSWIPDKQLQYKQSYASILKAIELLPPARRNIFKMSRVEGMTYEEIAGQMNISRNGVKDHIVKALLFLRNYIRFHSDTLPAIAAFLISRNLT